MLRRLVLMLVVLVMGLAMGLGMPGRAVAGGGGFGGGGGGGGGFGGGGGGFDPSQFNIDPDMLEGIQQMSAIGQEVFSNMQQAGEDPQQFFQDIVQQIQDGTFDQDALQQQMVTKGYMTAEMVTQMQTAQTKMASGVQKMVVNATYDTIKQLLNPTEQEWAILLPKVQRVLDLKAEVAQGGDTMNQGNTVLGIGGAGGLGGGLGGGGRGGARNAMLTNIAGPQGSESELGKAWKGLQSALEDKKLAEAQLKGKLDAWRSLHEKARAELRGAQGDLVSILTLRQEAVMLMVGVL